MGCPVCQQVFYPDSKPRTLPCGHTLCTPCLRFLHQYNTYVIPCPVCGGEEYFEDITEIPLNTALESQVSCTTQVPPNLGLEPRVAGPVLEEPDEFAPTAPLEDDIDLVDSPWESCLQHGVSAAWWCTSCDQALCGRCEENHLAHRYHLIDYAEARGILLSNHSYQNQAFLKRLLKVEKYTRESLEAAESVVSPLRKTLSNVRSQINRLAEQRWAMEKSTHIRAMEQILQEASRWREDGQVSTEQQIAGVAEAFQKFTSSMEELQQLHLKTEEKLVEARAVAGSLGQDATEHKRSEEGVSLTTVTVERESSVIAEPEVRLPLQLPFQGSVCVNLPASTAEPHTTHLEVLVPDKSGKWPWFELIYADSDASPLFTTRCVFGNDRVSMWAQNPMTRLKSVVTKRKHCGLREGVPQRVTITEDQNRYKVQVNGHMIAFIKKMAHQKTTLIQVKNHSMALDHSTQPTLEVVNFQVVSDDLNS